MLIFLLAPCIIELMDANDDSFFDQVSSVLAKRTPRHTLTIDESYTVHIPARVLARYDFHEAIQCLWSAKYAGFMFVFVKKADVIDKVDDISNERGDTLAIGREGALR
jgi:hypothetical protein